MKTYERHHEGAPPELRVLLIGGTSNVGKSTLARALAANLGWRVISTDSLARHPGRPWRTAPEEVPGHVAAYYLKHSPDELIEDVLHHYQTLWDRIDGLITRHAGDPSTEKLILEGSALWPAFVAIRKVKHVQAVWLTASDELLRQRIYTSSGIDRLKGAAREMVEKFVDRTLLFNTRMMSENIRQKLRYITINEQTSPDGLCELVIKMMFDQGLRF